MSKNFLLLLPPSPLERGRHSLWILLLIIFCLNIFANLSAKSEQHSTIQKIIDQSKYCQPNFYFSEEQIKSSDRHQNFLNTTSVLLEKTKADLWYSQSKSMNLVPLNLCAVRGNKEYYKEENKLFLKQLQVSKIINLDFLAHSIVQGKTAGFQYLFAPINPNSYPEGESAQLLLHSLSALSEASPSQRVYISCYHGKHRTSLLSAMYQFLGNYSNNILDACNAAKNGNYIGYTQAEQLANLGFLTYNMPSNYKEFFQDFTQAVCEEKSAEFFQELI